MQRYNFIRYKTRLFLNIFTFPAIILRFLSLISLRIPNNCVNFVVRLQTKGQRLQTKGKGLQAKDKDKRLRLDILMSMKILATSDWHLGNLFHGNDRLPEHKHFLKWLLEQIAEQKPDALLIAGDIFDNGNPSAAAQTVYYEFLADATQLCPNMQVIITAGNHDSASRLEAPVRCSPDTTWK